MTINQLGLQFDDNRFYQDLIKAMLEVTGLIARDLLLEMANQATMSETIESLRYTIPEMANGVIVSYVGSDHWKAFIDNFGRGSLMEQSRTANPWLTEYLQSGMFNNERFEYDFAILARRYGEIYKTPNWETGDGFIEKRGKYKGADAKILEGTHPRYDPRSASHFLTTAILHLEQSFQRLFWRHLSEKFSFSDYLKGGA